MPILDDVRTQAAKYILFLPHALRQMQRMGRMITQAEVTAVVFTRELVEDYPDDVRGHSCVLLGDVEAPAALTSAAA